MKGILRMADQDIYELASIFKSAMIAARDEGFFSIYNDFSHFPRGCCGETCYLLASFLREHGIDTLYVWGDYRTQSHAWLVVNDNRVKLPQRKSPQFDSQYYELISRYGGCISEETAHYTARDLTQGLIVDITADQFGEPSVFVGMRNDFYRKFKFRDAHICNGVSDSRLKNIYNRISSFLPKFK